MYRRAMGDPGFLGSLGKAVFGTVGGAIGGFLKGGPVAAITGAIGGATAATRSNVATATLAAGGSGSAYTPALRAQHARVLASAARGSTAPMVGSGAGTPIGRAMAGVTGGSSSTARMIATSSSGGGFGRKRRTMNPYNPRALRRANRRMSSFLKHARKFLGFYHTKAHEGKTVKFKRPRGRK